MGQVAGRNLQDLFVNKNERSRIEKEVNDEMEKAKKRYQPDGMETLIRQTKFNKKELQLLYRGFKESCPNGIVTFKQFLEIYSYFFPYGDATEYATCVFQTFDEDGNGEISFEEFATALSIISRGTWHEKIEWVFHLYDNGNKGYITKTDMERIAVAMYDLIGPQTYPPTTQTTPFDHANLMFEKYDKDHNGKIDVEEFIDLCSKDPTIVQSMELFRFAYTKAELAQLNSVVVTPADEADDPTEGLFGSLPILGARHDKLLTPVSPNVLPIRRENGGFLNNVAPSFSAPQELTLIGDEIL